MQTYVSNRVNLPSVLSRSIFEDRGRQFVDRLQWDLCVSPKGLEVDQYDDDQSRYLVVHKNGTHMGSCRVRPTTCSTMISDHFKGSFPDASGFLRMQKGNLYELTRFCRNPNISVTESRKMLGQLAILLDRFRDQYGLTGFVAVVFPQVARFLNTIGVRYLIVSRSKMDGQQVLMICITHAVEVGVTAPRSIKNDREMAMIPELAA